jgi:protein TonB
MNEIDEIPTPQPRPTIEAEPVEAKRAQEKIKEKPAKKTRKKVAEKAKPADKPAKTRKKAGSGGRNEADARRGVADGRADGRKEVSGSGGRTSAAGNAAVSNYPGKVAAKLRRSVRGVSRPARSRASNDVLDSFTVNAGGGLGGVRIARSSGSRELDKAALAIVRRAAPFPPIPPQSGRRNWAFTLPLGLR